MKRCRPLKDNFCDTRALEKTIGLSPRRRSPCRVQCAWVKIKANIHCNAWENPRPLSLILSQHAAHRIPIIRLASATQPGTFAADLASQLAGTVTGFACDIDLHEFTIEQAGAAPAMNRPATAVVHHPISIISVNWPQTLQTPKGSGFFKRLMRFA